MRLTANLRRVAIATTLAVAAVFAVSTAAYADPVEIEGQRLRDDLFVASVHSRTQGAQGLKDLVLSAELLGYHQRFPTKTRDEMLAHAAVASQWYDSHMDGTDFALQTYEALPHALTVMSAFPQGAVAAPIMKELLEMTVGPVGKAYSERINQVATSQYSYEQFERWYPVQDMVWRRITTQAQGDPTFAAAWDGNFGARLGVLSTASEEQLAADPAIATWMNVNALLEHANNTENYIAEARAQIVTAIGRLQTQNAQLIGQVGQLGQQFPVTSTTTPPSPATFSEQRQAAVDRQKDIDAAGMAIQALATALGFADPTAGRIVGGVGKSLVQVATAINKYIPSIAGLSLTQALTSMSTVALTGNILGAIGALLPVFADGPTPDQLLMDEIHRLRDQVGQLATTMTSRFDRVDHALTVMYGAMLDRFDEVVELQHATLAELGYIEKELYNLNVKIDNWGSAIMRALAEDKMAEVVERINWGVGHLYKYNEPIPTYLDYQSVENKLQTMATQTALDEVFSPKASTYPTLDPVTATRTYGEDGYGPATVMDYLDWYAATNYGTTRTSASKPVAIGPWTVSARGYARMVVENPNYASQVNEVRTTDILAMGQGLVNAARRFSKPLSTPDNQGNRTNGLYTAAMTEYRTALQSFSAELGAIRGANPDNKIYNVFGNADQPLDTAAQLTDPAKVGPCTGATASLTRPSTVSISQAPSALQFAKYAHPQQPSVRLCYSASFANVETVDDYKFTHTYADLDITFKIKVNWNGQEWDYRTWHSSWYLGEICRKYVTGAPGGFCNNLSYYLGKWDASYLGGFTASASVQTDDTPATYARNRMNEYLTGRQKAYYNAVVTALGAPASPLFAANTRLTRAVAMIQAYTQVGFAKAMSFDELLSLLTVGGERLPSDLDGVNTMTEAFVRAQVNYAGCSLTGPGGACAEGAQVVDPMANQKTVWNGCNANGAPGASGDPIGDCLLGIGQHRTNVLATRFEAHSRELAAGAYAEGLPDVVAVMEELNLANAFIRHA
ncbi:MAG: hypothetical protein HOU81_07740 [Hamadaea sp.]|uniref:hypothetical protein n=1 Tax=Hamadaea sp. TaxID=2024425 RepID=UPI001798F031|nr:hypothetical protein [Hamadaea sp.]NUR70698.1 hypothetical protein [Hamadaea sp.]NUT21790.1 hypothetical protein [Hamadaea sp.]